MKTKSNVFLALLLSIIFAGCASTPHYEFSLNNTLSIFMLNNGKDHFFCIPVQYMDDYQLGDFDFTGGYITIGEYEILLKRDEVNISVYLNEAAEEDGRSDSGFNLIYLEEKGKILLSKMDEPLKAEQDPDDGKYNHYYIFIEKFLKDNEVKKITSEYKKGNVYSRMGIEFDLVIDNEPQIGNGMYDDFELYDGLAIDPVWFPPNLNFFRAKYLQK